MRLKTNGGTFIVNRDNWGWDFFCFMYIDKTRNPERFDFGKRVPKELRTLLRLCYNLDHDHWVRK